MNLEINTDEFIDLQGDLERLKTRLKQLKRKKNRTWEDRLMIHVLKDLIHDRRIEIIKKGRYIYKKTGEYYFVLPESMECADEQSKFCGEA